MSEELMPCPHCEGEAFAVAHSRVNALGVTDYSGNVICYRCQASVGSDGFIATEDEAIASATKKWNRRAERTCTIENFDQNESDPVGWLGCSNCHSNSFEVWGVHNYCPCCGAKVVEEW